MQEHERN